MKQEDAKGVTARSEVFPLHPQAHSTAPRSLALASLEIGRVLADRDGVVFRAQGTCMYPTIRPGDVLRVRSCSVTDVAVGDIAVCRTPDYLFSHRVIGKGEHDGRFYLVTRPDRSNHGSDGRTFDENLLGVVLVIKRCNRVVPLQPADYSWLLRRYYAVRLALIEAEPHLSFRLTSALAKVQNLALYCRIARGIFAWMSLRISYNVRIPVNDTLGDALFWQGALGEFAARVEREGDPIERWTLTLHLNGAREPAAWITLVYNGDATWRVAELHTRLRYRGMGLEEMILTQTRQMAVNFNH